MKNKGFTLIEILAVIVILGIVASIAMISVSRYRNEANKRDLINLYSAVETSYNNYRLSVLNKGDEPEPEIYIKAGELYTNDEFTVPKTDVDAKSILRFFSDLAYSGNALPNDKLEIIITNKVSGNLLDKENYNKNVMDRLKKKYGSEEVTAMIARVVEINNATPEQQQELVNEKNDLLQKLDIFYVKDTTCKIKTAIVTGEEVEQTNEGEQTKQIKTIKKWCERTNENITNTSQMFDNLVPSEKELFCTSIKSNTLPLIDDFDKKKGLYHHNLCFTGGTDGYWTSKSANEPKQN